MPSHAKHAAALGLALAFLSTSAEGSYLTQLRGRRLDGSEDDGQDLLLTNSDVAPDLSLPSAEVNFMAAPGGAKSSKADLSFSMSLPSKSAKADMMEGKASKADLSYSLSMPSKSGKGSKAEAMEPGAKSVKSSKSDLSFSLSLPSKSGKSDGEERPAKASKAESEEDDGDVVAGAKSVKAAKAILDGSLSLSMPSGKAEKAMMEGGKASKSDLSFSLPSKSSKSELSFSVSGKSSKSAGDERPAKAAKADLSFSVSAKSAKAESEEPPVTTVPPVPGGKAGKAIDPDMMMGDPSFLLDLGEGSLSMSL
ncbi:hypothetical protein ACHAXT_003420 [Thalassiosira profunda]